ncbi:S8 family serine peptidase [Fretibacterium fastidiosum]|uniref:S8 family serine peptidase n=1 Tax=Fretibacterium fastidiosum TaxID=651822 RepID=UPI0002EC46AF|nr:S8 family serine peptidase [Fretibacterium fastidiosum]
MRKLRPILISVLALVALFALTGAAAARCVPGEVLAVFKGEGERVSASSVRAGREAFRAASIAAAVGARVEETYPNLSEAGNGVFVRLSGATSGEDLVRNLLQRDDVLAASLNYVVQASAREPNDPGFPALWGLKAIRAPEAWDLATGSDDVYVAVMDSGIDTTAQRVELANVDGTLSRSFVPRKPSWQDEDGHGTHVAGTIGAKGNNGTGVVGVNWNVRLISLRTMNEKGLGWTGWMIRGVEYLIGLLKDRPNLKLAAVNASLGWYAPVLKPEEQGRDVMWQVLKALDNTNRVVLVVAAGNERTEVGAPAPRDGPMLPGTGEPLYKKGECAYPASYRGLHNMIAVGAVSTDLTFAADFSNYSGAYVDVAAPGVNILSTTCAAKGWLLSNDIRVAGMAGTSMAAPHVTGAAALLKAADPTRTAYQIRTALIEGAAKNRPALVGKVAGGRLLDVRGALDYQMAHGDLPSAPNQPSIPDQPSSPDQPPSPGQPETPGGPDDAPGSSISASYIQLDSDRVANGVDLSFTLVGCRYDEAAKRAQIKDPQGNYVGVWDPEVLIDDTPVQHEFRYGGDSARVRVPAVEVPKDRVISLRVRAQIVSGDALLTTRYKSVKVEGGQGSGGSSGGGCDVGLGALALALPLLALSARRRG